MLGASPEGAPLEDPSVSLLRGQLGYVILGTVFLFIGVTACSIAAIRRRSEVRILIWLGIWSGMFGASRMFAAPAVIASLPRLLQAAAPYVRHAISYLLVVAALLAWSELSAGTLRRLTRSMAVLGLAIGAAGIGSFVFTGAEGRILIFNNVLAACALLILTIVVMAPGLSARFLLFPNPILSAATLIFTLEALYTNLSGVLHLWPSPPYFLDELAFAAFLSSFAYVAARQVFAKERRLLSIESELEVARQIQTSILPATVPQVDNLRIAAAYRPMTAVAGDFYEFIQPDASHVGILVADVSGHGVPAALIASMIKVAVQSVVACAHDPAEVLRRLNGILHGQLRGQFVTAAYLWIDVDAGMAFYSAAGHPPLLCWRNGEVRRIESNGLLFGVLASPDYPVCEMPVHVGDRFLIYTDGVVEPENSAGDAFGDRRLEEVMRRNQSRSPSDFSADLLSEIGRWQPASVTQQDDITLVVIDVV
jgi:sigma-B regulation protein RsbU (phosphoserine phosphatase)